MTTLKVTAAAVALGLGLAASAGAAVTFSDSTPSTSGLWAKVVDPAAPLGGLYVINIGNSVQWYTASSYLISGFPHSGVANVYWGVGSRFTNGTYDPSADGAISSIDYSITSRKGSYDGVRVALLLIQDGKYYRSEFHTQLPGAATPEEVFTGSGLTASDFGEFVGKAYDYATPADGTADFGSNPDFSATGSPIQLGYLAHFDSTLASASSSTAYQMTRAWSVTLHQVPEPASLGLMGLGGLAALGRKRCWAG